MFWLIVLWVAGAVVLLCGLGLVVVVSVQAARNRREWRRFGERFDEAVRTHRTEWLRDE